MKTSSVVTSLLVLALLGCSLSLTHAQTWTRGQLARMVKGQGEYDTAVRVTCERLFGEDDDGSATFIALRDLAASARVAELREAMENEIGNAAPDAVVFAGETERLPNTSCFAVPGMQAETLVIALDLAGVAVSAGSACSSGKVGRSHVLEAMGVVPDLGKEAIRVSLGWNTMAADVERFLGAWKAVYDKFAARRAAA